MIDFSHIFPLALAVFAGAAVSSFAGFAFSAIAGAILLHVLSPTEAVPLMMACSIMVQGANLVCLRHTLDWRGSLAFILGGIVGIPPSLYVLFHVNGPAFRVGFGIFLVVYAGYMLLRPSVRLADIRGRFHDAAVGFAGGLVGGLTAMPGALPTIWCDLRGLPKERQRGLVQPFIAAMQIVALALLMWRTDVSLGFFRDFLIGLPALAAGAALGLVLFKRLDGTHFRRAMLVTLLIAGVALAA
jgi:uncharacterized membrane protein YfcA